MVMNYLFFGVQGSGKGTEAKIISEKLKIPHISTGDLLRSIEGELRKDVDSYILNGRLVPDELMLKILKARISQTDCEKGFILDGFPRNIKQARELDKIVKIDNAFNIEVSDELAIKRLRARWNCKKCGIMYNYVSEPKPKQEGICDICGEKLYQRHDDADDRAIEARIKTYHEETKPVLKFYNTIEINGEQSIKKVAEDILKAIEMLKEA